MNKNKSMKKKSSIFSFLTRFSEYIYSQMPKSLAAKLLVGKKKTENGLFSRLISKINFKKRVSLPVKRYIAKSFDSSYILGYLKGIISKIPLIQLKCVGMFYFSFGLYSTIANLIKMNLVSSTNDLPLYLSIGSFVVGGLLCASQKNCYAAFSESKIMSRIFFGFFKIPTNNSFLRGEPIGRPTYFLIAGVVAGVLGSITSVPFILLLFPLILAVYAVFAFPECGAVALFLAIPFLSFNQLGAFGAIITLSWFIKLIRGKRVLKFNYLDLSVLAFGIAIFFGGVISVSPSESSETAYLFLVMLATYFAVSNLLRTSEWIKKCGAALVISFTVSLLISVIGVAIRLMPTSATSIFDGMFSKSILSLMYINPIFIHMAVAVIPLMLMRSLTSKNASKSAWSVIAVLLTLIYLFIGGSRSGTFAVLLGVTLLLMLVSKRSLSYIIPVIIIVPIVIALLPSNITDAVNKMFSFDGTIASYRQNVNYTSNKMIFDSFLGGIGLGEGAFTKIYPLYANDLSQSMTHTSALYSQIAVSLGISGLIVFLVFVAMLLRRYFSYIVSSRNDDANLKNTVIASFAGIASLLVMGLIDHIWLSPSVFLMFWLITALFSASIKTAEAERYSVPSNEPTLELDCNTLNHFSKRKG